MVSRTVIVTGGFGGIGRAVARTFAREGANIVLVDLRVDDGAFERELVTLGCGGVAALSADIGEEATAGAAVGLAVDTFGSLDVVVNVAGAMLFKPLADFTAADWELLLKVNLVGAALLVGQAFRVMKPGSSVVNVASVHALRTTPRVAPYAAAKAALVSLTRSAAIEGKALGIRVNAVLPGAIDTPMLRDSPTIRSGEEVLSPDDVGQPEDIAALVAFLASDAARFISGAEMIADGGRMGRL